MQSTQDRSEGRDGCLAGLVSPVVVVQLWTTKFATEGMEVSLGGLTLAGNGAQPEVSFCASTYFVCFNLIQLFSMRKHPYWGVGEGGILFSESHPLSNNNGILSFFQLNTVNRFLLVGSV